MVNCSLINTFDASTLLDEDHLICSLCRELEASYGRVYKSDRTSFNVAINVVSLGDQAWLNDVLGVNLDTESIIEEFKLMNKNYPLLRIVGRCLHSHWNDLKSNADFEGNPNTNDDIIEYILLCDNKGREGECVILSLLNLLKKVLTQFRKHIIVIILLTKTKS
jgi:hypothetical protein